MKIIITNFSVLWMDRLLIIRIQGQLDIHPRDLGEEHFLSLSVNIRNHIYSKHARNEDYIMVYVLPTISKSGVEYAKWRKHGCALFVMCKTCMMSNGTVIPGLEGNFFIGMFMITIRGNIDLPLTLLVYDIEYEQM